MKRIAEATKKEMRELVGHFPVNEIAELFGVDDMTVYYHTSGERRAEIRREQWRKSSAKRKARIASERAKNVC